MVRIWAARSLIFVVKLCFYTIVVTHATCFHHNESQLCLLYFCANCVEFNCPHFNSFSPSRYPWHWPSSAAQPTYSLVSQCPPLHPPKTAPINLTTSLLGTLQPPKKSAVPTNVAHLDTESKNDKSETHLQHFTQSLRTSNTISQNHLMMYRKPSHKTI